MKKTPEVELPETICPEIKEFIRKTISIDYYERMTKDEFKKLDLDQIDMAKLTEMRSKGMSPARKTLSKSIKKPMMLTPIKNISSGTNRLRNMGALTPRPGQTHQNEAPKPRRNNNSNNIYSSKLTAEK